MALKLRRGLNANRTSITPAEGELIYVTDHIAEGVVPLWVGDDETPGGNPVGENAVISVNGQDGIISLTTDDIPAGSTNKYYDKEVAQDDIADMFTSGSHTGISFTYNITPQDSGNRIDAALSSEYIEDVAAALLTSGSHTGISFSYVDNGSGTGAINATVTGGGGGTGGNLTSNLVLNSYNITGSGGIGITTGNISTTTGNISTTTGNITVGTGNINVSAGNITAVNGTITAVGEITGRQVHSVKFQGTVVATFDNTVTFKENQIQVNSTLGMTVNDFIAFTGTTFGGLTVGVFYFIKSIVNSTHIQISTTLGGPALSLTTASGTCTYATGGYVYGDLVGNIRSLAGQRVWDSETGTFYPDEIIFSGKALMSSPTGDIAVNVDRFGILSQKVDITRDSAYVGTTPWVQYSQYHNTADAENVTFSRARGTLASPATTQSGDDIIDLAFAGYDGSTFVPSGAISVTVDGTVSTNIVPTRITFATMNSSGTLAERLRVNSSKVTFSVIPQVPTYASEAAANTAVGTPTNGMIFYDSGSSVMKGYGAGAWHALW